MLVVQNIIIFGPFRQGGSLQSLARDHDNILYSIVIRPGRRCISFAIGSSAILSTSGAHTGRRILCVTCVVSVIIEFDLKFNN